MPRQILQEDPQRHLPMFNILYNNNHQHTSADAQSPLQRFWGSRGLHEDQVTQGESLVRVCGKCRRVWEILMGALKRGFASQILRENRASILPGNWAFWGSLARPSLGHTPSTAGTFWKKFRKNSGKTPETLSERFLEFPSRVRLGCLKPYNSRHSRLPERFQNSLPPPEFFVPERASQSRSWNSQQYWGYF